MTLTTARRILALANSCVPYEGESERKLFFRLCAEANSLVKEAERPYEVTRGGSRHLRHVCFISHEPSPIRHPDQRVLRGVIPV